MSILDTLNKKKATEATTEVAKPEEKTYQVYKSSMQAHKIPMPSGKVLHVTEFQLVTANQKEIEFLDAEIEEGFPYLRKVDSITSTELDPIANLRAKMKEELRLELQAEMGAGEEGKKDPNPTATKTAGIGSTASLASVSGNSNSVNK